ncbi:MAG TPA: VWA domain-containing protein, partial [Rhodanobacteraceae bacterium]|nr:VWA domain-containing protein [Rhodanobacteraceae bacterium]
MLEWAWPWLLVALPLPWLVARLWQPAHTQASAALRLPYALDGLDAASGANPVSRWRRALAILAWCALVVAAARPQWVGEAEALPRSGRDLLLAAIAIAVSICIFVYARRKYRQRRYRRALMAELDRCIGEARDDP